MIDLLVVGAGPAGLASAIAARQAGMARVVVLDRQAGTIDKACGEGLMPGALAALDRLGVTPPEGVPLRGIRYRQGARELAADFGGGPGLGVRRVTLHAALAARADELGVERRQAEVGLVQQDGEGVRAAGLRARWLVAADGLRSAIRGQLGLERPARRPARCGIRRHFARAPWSEHVEVHLAPAAEAYVTPVTPDLVGVALLFDADSSGTFAQRLERDFPELALRLPRACTSTRGAGPFEQNVARRVSGRVLLVGDAAGYLDPLTGEGIKLGLESALAAAEALAAERPQDYERAWRRLTRDYFRLTALLLWARRSRLLGPRLVRLLQAQPWLFRDNLNRLAGGRARAPSPEPAPDV